MVAACFAMMAPSALAEETNPAQQITVTAQNIGDGKYLLDVTNNGSEDLTDVHGVTTVPQELTKLGLDPRHMSGRPASSLRANPRTRSATAPTWC